MSDTPISDSTPHNIAELGILCRRLERLASVRLDYIEQFEAEIDRLSAKVAQLYEGSEEQKQRIKRLEEAGIELRECASWVGPSYCQYVDQIRRAKAAIETWDKEAKL